jgi:ABC-2 type transport system permease protein
MHKPIRALIRIQLKMQYHNVFKKPSVIIGFVFGLLGILFLGLMLGGFVLQVIDLIYTMLEPSGNSDIILGSLFLMNFIVVLLLSLTLIMNGFYFTEDITSFLHFPVHSYQLLIAKSVNPLVYVYLVTAATYFPVSMYYGVLSGAGIVYSIFALLLFFVIPIIPYSLASVIVMFAMQFVNKGKNKDRSKVIGGILGFILLILLNIVLRLQHDPEKVAETIASSAEGGGMLQMATMYYPPAWLMTNLLTTDSLWMRLLYLIIVLVIALASFWLFYAASQKLYLKGALGLNTGSGKQFNGKGLYRKQTSVVHAYRKKEIQTIFRTPTFFLQCVAGTLIMPALLVVIVFMGDFTSAASLAKSLDGSGLYVAILAVNILTIGLNPVSIVSFSKDGHSWEAHLFLPLKMWQIVLAKLQAAFLINLLPITVMFLVAVFVLQLTIWQAMLWLFLALLVNAAVTIIGMLSDLFYPKLGWSEETELFQNRLASLIAIVLSVGSLGILIALLLVLNMQMFVSLLFTVLYISLLVAALLYTVSRLLRSANRTTLTK